MDRDRKVVLNVLLAINSNSALEYLPNKLSKRLFAYNKKKTLFSVFLFYPK